MNVLMATDGSKYGRWGLNWVATLPLVERPSVIALHVLDVGALRAPFLAQPVMAGNERYIQEEIQRMEARSGKTIEEATRQLASLKLKGTARKEQGAVAPVILKHAPKRDGLLVVGSQGLDALDRFMLGSVSTKLVHHAPCSVLVVKEAPRLLRRVVLATDGSKSSEKALQFLLRKMRSAKMNPDKGREEAITVTVVHVMPFLKYPEVKETGNALVHYYADRLTMAGYQVVEAPRFGKPADEIIKVAHRHKADLIVTGAKGLGAIARFLLGSVSTKLVQHSSCSVLLVR